MTAGWLIPALIYIGVTGALGVTAKLAFRTLEWPELIIWSAIAYSVASAVLIAIGMGSFHINRDGGFAALTGALAVGGLVTFSIAVGAGEVSRVVPITAAYPLVALILSVLILSEIVTPGRVVGALLVVIGVVLLSRE